MKNPNPHITLVETSQNRSLATIARSAFEEALRGQGQMDAGVYEVDGFCGRKHRLFFNNLVRKLDDPRYLEVGIFRGATLCAALAGNKLRCCGIDNWSEYDGKAHEFYANLAKYKGETSAVSILEQDFRSVDYAHIGKFNMYFYDGPHLEEDQYDGIKLALPALDDQAILVVDDWNWERVRRATLAALSDASWQLDFSIELRTSLDNGIPEFCFRESDWHNGLFAGVISRPTI